MFDRLRERHDAMLVIAKAAVLIGSDLGFPFLRWRDFVRKLLDPEGLPQPDDLVA